MRPRRPGTNWSIERPPPLPRNAVRWHPQFAQNGDQSTKLKRIGTQSVVGDGELPADVDLLDLGPTTVLCGGAGGVGNWRRIANTAVLTKPCKDRGHKFTTHAILFWWVHAQKFIKKRDHPTSSPGRKRKQLCFRKRELGHWRLFSNCR